MPITTLLFDLDGTLLDHETDQFITAYLKLFSAYLAPRIDPQRFVTEILKGTQHMLQNKDFTRTLEQTFSAHFYPALNTTQAELQPQLDDFYRTRFADLRAQTQGLPSARAALTWATQTGLRLSLATNPLFPRTAIEQRLQWAEVSEFKFELVTSFEFMHFAKPTPEYYAETLAWLDVRPEEALMIGNDWERDIAPAQTLGINGYWVAPRTTPPPATAATPVPQGTLPEFIAWLQNDCLPTLQPLTLTPRAAQAQLAAIPAVMHHRAQTIRDWHAHQSEAWALNELACHLRDVEVEVNQPRIQKLLREENPFIAAIDSDVWAEPRGYAKQDGVQAFTDFLKARRETLALLEPLDLAAWQRPARHSVFGPTTLHELMRIASEHDRTHLRQISELQNL